VGILFAKLFLDSVTYVFITVPLINRFAEMEYKISGFEMTLADYDTKNRYESSFWTRVADASSRNLVFPVK